MNDKGSSLIDVIIGINLLIILAILCFRIIFVNQRMLFTIENIDKLTSFTNLQINKIMSNEVLETDIFPDKAFSVNVKKEYFGNEMGKDFYMITLEINNEAQQIKREYKILVRE